MEYDPKKRYGTPAELQSELLSAISRFEKGDLGIIATDQDAKTGEGQADEPANEQDDSAQGAEREGQNRRVMVIESKMEIQDVMRQTLKKRGYRVLVFRDPERALARFEEDPLETADIAIFSAVELASQALDAFNRFGGDEITHDIPAILLVTEKQENIIRQAKTAPHRGILFFPLRARKLRAALLKLLSTQAPAESESPDVPMSPDSS
jgi:serine/threonine-protein kinase